MNFTAQFLNELEKQKKKKALKDRYTRPASDTEENASTVTQTITSADTDDAFSKEFLKELERFREEKSLSDASRQGLLDDDIAPVRTDMTITGGDKKQEKAEDEEDDGGLDFFDKGALGSIDLRQGNAGKQIAKAILGTTADLGVGAAKGVIKIGEGLGDAGMYWVADAFADAQNDEMASRLRSKAIKNSIDDAFAPVDKYLDKYSVMGDTLNAVSEGIGQAGAIVATGGIAGAAGASAAATSAITTGILGVSSFGSSTGEAYREGAAPGEAELYGAIAGTADALTELLSGGLGKAVKATGLSHGLGEFDDIIADKLTKNITNTIAKNAVQFGVKATGEGLEEVLAGTVQAVAKWRTYASEEDLLKLIEDQNLLEQFVVGAMSSAAMQAPGLVQSNNAGADFVTGRTQNEQAVIDRVVEQRIKDAETDGKKLSPKEKQDIEEQAVSDMERGQLDIDTIEEVLAGDEYKEYQDKIKEEDALRKEYEELGNLTNPTLAEKTRFDELHQKSSEFTSDDQRNAMKQKLDERVSQMVESDRLVKSFTERLMKRQRFEDDVNKYESDAAKKTVQNLIDSGVASNSNRTHEMAETVAKISNEKGIVFNFTNDEKIKAEGKTYRATKTLSADGETSAFSLGMKLDSDFKPVVRVGGEVMKDGYTVDYDTGKITFTSAPASGDISVQYQPIVRINGYKTADGITVNLSSPKAWQFIVGHEVTHTLEGSAAYNELTEAVKAYAQTKGEYDSRRESIASLYSDGTDIDSELTSDMVGEYLFTDEQFVQELSTKHQNVFQKIFAEIKHLLKMVTAGSKEARQLEQVKHTFEKAYRAAQQGQQGQAVQHSLVGENANIDKSRLTVAKQMETDGKTSEEIYAETGWYKQSDGKWRTEIPDEIMIPENFSRTGLQSAKDAEADRYLARIKADLDDGVISEEVYTELEEFAEGVRGKDIKNGKLPSFLNAPQLYEAYPQLKKVNLTFRKISAGQGYSDIGQNQIVLDPEGLNDAGLTVREGLAHEIQHFIQNIEGFASGSSPEAAGSYEAYRKAGGEIEARDVEDRLRMSAEDRRKYMPTQFSLSADTQGRPLSNGQREYFRESKVTDENGNLKVMYHGTYGGDFTIFDKKKAKSSGTFGRGFYFSDSKSHAGQYGNTFEVYLNITNPLQGGTKVMTNEQIRSFVEAVAENEDYGIENYGYDATVDSVAESLYGKTDFEVMMDVNLTSIGNMAEALQLFNEVNGTHYDGIITPIETVVFEPQQIKNVDNLNPTGDPDIRRSLSDAGAPVGGRGTPARDLLYQGEDIAPVQQTAAEVDTLDAAMFPDDLSMMSEDEGTEYDRLNSFSDEDAPPENVAPYYGDEDTQSMPDDPFENRDIKAVGKRNVESFMSANPEVKPFFQQEANVLLGELERTVKGERFMSADGEWTGTSRHTTDDIAYLLDELKYSYADIRRGLDAIIEGEGAENIAVAKRIEFIINDRLTKGYTDAFSGVEIPPDSEYLNLLREKQVTEYNAASVDALMADADAYAPPITEDSAPVMENTQAPAAAAAEIDAPMAETAAQVEADTQAAVDEIRTTYDKLLAKKQNAEVELAKNREQRAAASQRYQERIDELTRKYNGKKNKETKAAINLQRQISRLERLRADVDADYAKRISDIEQRISRRDFDLQQDHTQADKLERAYAKIDAQMESERAAVTEEFAQRREELSAAVSDKNEFVGRRAMELYRELSNLKKGVRASYELGYLLDRGYDWRTLKSTLLKVNLRPGEVINPDSVMESDIRSMLAEEHKSKTYELAELDGEMQDRLAQLDTEAEKQKAEVRKGEQQLRRKQLHQNIMDGMRTHFAQRGYDLDELLRTAKNVSGFKTVDKTPQRVNFAAFGDGAGDIMNDLTVNLVAQHQTDGIRWLNRFTDRKTGFISQISKQYQIKPGSKESAAAQMYAEGFYVNKYDEVVSYGDRELAIDFPDAKVRENIKKLAHDPRIRQIYDETLDMINESRVRNAYPEIPKRENYFLHFREMGDFFSKNGLPFNPNDMRLKDLPTDINGVTADLKPGQPYFASSKQREGKRTSFDLLGGLEQYLTSAMPQIYHIDDIQTLRALRNYIADDFGQAKGLESLDGLTEEEVQERIDLVYGNHLSNYARFLNEEANIIAGKTALIDRALEGVIGRRGMTFMSDLNKQVGANQVGYSASSALSNVIAAVQAFAKMNKTAFVKGFSQMVSNRVGGIFGRGDNFAQESSVMVRREGAQRFKRNFWQKQQDAAYALMGAVDSVVTEVIARGKYNELTAKGVSSDQAHYETDKWVSALMGDRSLGQQPHLFNSKTFGMILKYQLEVRNQLDSQFEDTFREARMSTAEIEDVKKRNAIKAAKITSTLVTLAVSQHLFGTVMESITGYNPTFDIIEAIIKAAGWDDDEDDDDTVLDNLEQGLLSLAEDMPYYSILSGGRIPMESALPIEQLIKGKDSYGNDKSRLETLAEAAPYYLLPGGYGQIKKTGQGLFMYLGDHPVAGSYTGSDNLRFPVGEAPLDIAQAAVFGQYSSGNARDYFEGERKPLSEKQINEYAAADMTIQEYWKYRDGLSEHDNLAAQADYINSLDIPVWKKNLFINNLTERKEAIDMTEYGQYGSLAEMDFAKKSPEKYKLIQDHGVSYEQYQAFDDDTKGAYSWAAENSEKYDFIRDIGYTIDDYAHATDEQKDAWTWAYKNPEKYTLSRAVSDDLFTYRGYTGALNDIKADKDADGKSISGSRKEKVIDYINGLDADYGQKIILFKSEYPSEDSYNNDIIDYLNERDDISAEEMAVILTELGFKVSSDGTVTWD